MWCDVGCSLPGALTNSETNKQFAATRWDDAHSLHGETNNSLCYVETRRHKQLPSLLVVPTRMLKLEWFDNLQGYNLRGMSPLSCGCHRSGIIASNCRARGPNASGPSSHCSSPELPHGVVVSLDLRRPEHRVGHIVAAAMDDFAMRSCALTRHPTFTLHELQRARHVGMMRNAFRQTGCAIRGSRVRNVVSAPCPSGFRAPKGPDRDAQDALLSAPHVREGLSLGMPTVPTAADKSCEHTSACGRLSITSMPPCVLTSSHFFC